LDSFDAMFWDEPASSETKAAGEAKSGGAAKSSGSMVLTTPPAPIVLKPVRPLVSKDAMDAIDRVLEAPDTHL